MAKKIETIISRFAEDDLNEIVEYYYQINKSYAEKILTGFENQVEQLKNFPKIGRIVLELERQGIEKYREVIEGYYRIVYEVTEQKVIIHTIIDGRRNFEDIIISKLMRYYNNDR